MRGNVADDAEAALRRVIDESVDYGLALEGISVAYVARFQARREETMVRKSAFKCRPYSVTVGQNEFVIGRGGRLPERHHHAKPEGRLRAAGDDLVLSDRKWHGADVLITADL
jgi:hypothetical protein